MSVLFPFDYRNNSDFHILSEILAVLKLISVNLKSNKALFKKSLKINGKNKNGLEFDVEKIVGFLFCFFILLNKDYIFKSLLHYI